MFKKSEHGRTFNGFAMLWVFLWLAFSVAPSIQLDRWQWGMLFTYPPRLFLIAVSVPLLVWTIARRKPIATGFLIACLGFFLFDLGIRVNATIQKNDPIATTSPSPADDVSHPTNAFEVARDALIRVFSFNVHDQLDQLDQLHDYCREHQIDILCLQEAEPQNWSAFASYFPEFVFLYPDAADSFEFSDDGAFSNLIAVRATRLASFDSTTETAITGYRTLAARVELDAGPLWVVNVHTTKSFRTRDGVLGAFLQARAKSTRHRNEVDALNTWIGSHIGNAPILVAGDFNAPLGSYHLRLDSMTNAQSAATSTIHRSFPRQLPIWGIDHILTSEGLDSIDYQLIDMGFSDHLAQKATLRLEN